MAELAISSQYRHLYINNIYLYLNSATHVCMPVLRSHNNNNNNPADIVNSFSDHFQALYNSLPPARYIVPDFGIGSNHFHFLPVTVEAVLDGLKSLVVAKASGPDGLAARILKLAAPMIAGSLTTFFNVCLTEGVFPDDWKLANIYPVFKSGNSQLLTNYRPISVLSILAKVFESLVHRQIYLLIICYHQLCPAFVLDIVHKIYLSKCQKTGKLLLIVIKLLVSHSLTYARHLTLLTIPC